VANDTGLVQECQLQTYVNVNSIVKFYCLAKNVYPLTEICELPHVADLIQDRIAATHGIGAIVERPLARRHFCEVSQV
jgi:hypothetical protein